MSTHQNLITIADPDKFAQTFKVMAETGQAEAFAKVYIRLINLIAGYLAVDTPDERCRTALIWANHYQENDFFWVIQEKPRDKRSANQVETTLLGGGLHYHTSDNTWTINT